MNRETIRDAIALAEKVGHVFVATAGTDGKPHMASARRLTMAPDGVLSVAEWFCPGTVQNVLNNPQVSVVVWDAATDTGYQLLGRVEETRDVSMLDGYLEEEARHPIPQVETLIRLRVDAVLAFTHAPHSDLVL